MRDEHGHPIDPCMAGHTEAVEAAGDICPECRGGITVRRGRVRPYRIACPGCGGSARGEDFRRIKALREDVEDGEEDYRKCNSILQWRNTCPANQRFKAVLHAW